MSNQDWRPEYSGKEDGPYQRSYRRAQYSPETDDGLLDLDEDPGTSYRRGAAGSSGSSRGTGVRSGSDRAVNRGGRSASGRTGGRSGSGKRRRKKNLKRRLIAHGLRILCVMVPLFIVFIAWSLLRPNNTRETRIDPAVSIPVFAVYDPLAVDPDTRPGIQVPEVKGIVIHASDRTGLSAKELRDVYESSKDSGREKASTNFILDNDGAVICCVPPGELAYATEGRDLDTISVTVCTAAMEGEMSQQALDRLVELTVWLCGEYGLDADAVMRHYDASGIRDPLAFVEDPESWDAFLARIREKLEGTPAEETTLSETESSSEDTAEGVGDDNTDVEVGEEEPLPDGAVEE